MENLPYVGAKVAPDDAMPILAVLCVEVVLDGFGDLVLDVGAKSEF